MFTLSLAYEQALRAFSLLAGYLELGKSNAFLTQRKESKYYKFTKKV